jgi:hypothetical protein
MKSRNLATVLRSKPATLSSSDISYYSKML